MNDNNILLRHNFVSIPAGDYSVGPEALATILMNISYYGYALSVEAYKAVAKLDPKTLASWWADTEAELKVITGDNRKIGDFVVYKNFPAECLEKSSAEYWLPQILMYWGFPNEFFTEPVEPRAKMNEQKKATVIRKAKKDTLKDIFTSYLKSPARWKDEELTDVLHLSDQLPINLGKIAFKENLVRLASYMMTNGKKINISNATDVLRLAAGLSDGDVSLREKVKFISFKKPVRRFLLSTLESCTNLEEDVARRPELFKRLMHQLHPGDYKKSYPNVVKVNDSLYNDRLETFNSHLELLLKEKSEHALKMLTAKPGEFRRRLVHTLDLFGDKAVKAFTHKDVLEKLTIAQVVTLRTYLETVNSRVNRVFPPKGNWNKVQIGEARHVDEKHIKPIVKALGKQLEKRLPPIKNLDELTELIKLPNNGETSPYARGTVFPIPKTVKFIRTASYWKQETDYRNVWFDNGWNFFDKDWKSKGFCCWTNVKFPDGYFLSSKDQSEEEVAAVFSGDPTNSKEMKGRAAQLIDLYPEQLKKQGVRYAVWNILCFSNIPFADAEDVFAALQWGEDAQAGKLFEPSRCQWSAQLTGDQKTKYICVIDLETNEMIYLDANLHGNTKGADMNSTALEKNMPPFMEYIRSLPSVYDLFRESVDKNGDIQILYSDKEVELKGGSAFVFKPENKENKYKSVDLNGLLT